MKSALLLHLLLGLILTLSIIGRSNCAQILATTNDDVVVKLRIYQDLAEFIQPIITLPLEFSFEDWSYNIYPDSLRLIGSNISVTRKMVTQINESMNNEYVYVRSPSSSQTETKFVKAKMIDEKKNLVQLIDNSISEEPILFTVLSNDILYIHKPHQSRYYVDFMYNATDTIYLSYLRANLKWTASYELDIFQGSVNPILNVMAEIQNDGHSKIDIERAELIGGDSNYYINGEGFSVRFDSLASTVQPLSSVGQATDINGRYVFPINQPFSIDGNAKYSLTIFRPQVDVTRFGLINVWISNENRKFSGYARRSYRLSADHFLLSGNCFIREHGYLLGRTSLPNLAAKNQHEFSFDEDQDITYDGNVTLVTRSIYNKTIQTDNKDEQRTESVYNVNVLIKNFKTIRSIKVEYKQAILDHSIKLLKSNGGLIKDGKTIEYKITLLPGQEKLISYSVETIN